MSNPDSRPIKTLAGILSAFICYGAWIVIALGSVAFVMGTADFREWGQAGRFASMAVMLIGGLFYSIFMELGEVRHNIALAIADMIGGEA